MNIHHKDPKNQDHTLVSQPVLDEVCRALSGVLSDGVDVHRCLAAKASGRIGEPAVVKPLIAALLDEDEDVRTDAAEALLELADPQAGQQLMENLLGDPCTEVKLAAIGTLAKLQDKQVIPWLRRMVKGRDEEIVWDEEEFYDSGWDDWVDIQIKSVEALAELNAGEAVPDIVAAMGDENAQDMTEIAFKALARMGGPGIEALDRFLDNKLSRIRRRAAAALASIDTAEAAEPLARAFADKSAEVRGAALRGLAERVPADERLEVLLEDPDAGVRGEAVQLCGALYPDRLADMIDDASKSVQVAVLTALSGIQSFPADEAVVTALKEKLETGTGEIIAAAARALANIAPQAALDDLISVLGDTSHPLDARLGALRGLAEIGGERPVEMLADMINDEARTIRLETMPALARLAGADPVWPNAAGNALLFALRGGYTPEDAEDAGDSDGEAASSDDPVQEQAEPASEIRVENNDGTGAFPLSTLGAMLDDAPQIREVAGLPDKGVELTPMDMERLAIAKQVRGKKRISLETKVVLHEDIRLFAARVLGDLPHADVAQELAFALEQGNDELCMAAADSLARIGAHLTPLPEAVTQILMAKAQTANRDLKLLLIRALSASRGEEAPAFLAEQIQDDDSFIRAEAVRALALLGQGAPQIEALLGDPDPAVRLSAAQAVAGFGGDGAVAMLVDFASSFEGYHGRDAARLLRELDATGASSLFIEVLQNPDVKRIWAVAIEALEELNCSQPALTAEV